MKIIKNILYSINKWGDSLSQTNKMLYTYQISRTIIAFATLCTILFSNENLLFTHSIFENPNLKTSIVYKINLFFILGYNNIFWSKLISCIVLLAVISGYFHKILSIFHWYITLSLYASIIIVDGGDQISTIITLLLIPISFCDDRKNTWNTTEPQIPKKSNFILNSFLIIIQLQIAIIYLNSGVAKISVAEWMNGSAYYYWFMHNAFGAPDYIKSIFGNLLSNPMAVLIITWGTIIFETFMFGCFFSNNQTLKRFMFLIGSIFHFLIFIFHGLYSFFLIMLACIIMYLLSNGKDFTLKFKKIQS